MDTTITFEDHHLAVLTTALEVLTRMRMGQFKIALKHALPVESSRLGWDAVNECESLLKSKYFPDFPSNSYPGIMHERVGPSGHLAYEMLCVIDQWRALSSSDGWFGSGKQYDGFYLNPSGKPPIKIDGLDELQYKDFEIPEEDQEEAKSFFKKEDWLSLWTMVKRYSFPQGESEEIIIKDNNIWARIFRPRK